MMVRGWTLEELGEEAGLSLAYLLAGGDPPRSAHSFRMARDDLAEAHRTLRHRRQT